MLQVKVTASLVNGRFIGLGSSLPELVTPSEAWLGLPCVAKVEGSLVHCWLKEMQGAVERGIDHEATCG